MNVIIYTRDSIGSVLAKNQNSTQEETCTAFAFANRIKVEDTYKDVADGMYIDQQVNLSKLIDLCITNVDHLDAVIVESFDRISRDYESARMVAERLDAGGIDLISVNEPDGSLA